MNAEFTMIILGAMPSLRDQRPLCGPKGPYALGGRSDDSKGVFRFIPNILVKNEVLCKSHLYFYCHT